MDKEIQIIQLLNIWLNEVFFEGTTSLIRNEVSFKIDEFNFRADVIAIQSKSNIIHGFEVKSKLRRDRIISAIWQTNSYYTNYKWLVINENDKGLFKQTLTSVNENLLNIGIITFDEINKNFKVLKQAKYNDGNFLKFIPDLEEEWLSFNKSEKK